jgi:hypothetical protein
MKTDGVSQGEEELVAILLSFTFWTDRVAEHAASVTHL